MIAISQNTSLISVTNLIDWGSTNFIAAGIERSVYLWQASTNKRQELKISNHGMFGLNCIKWHPNGKNIAWSSLFGQFEVISLCYYYANIYCI